MSTISGMATTSASSAWPAAGARTARPPGGAERGEMKDRMFAKVDADGSGGVDATELQNLLDKVAKKTGVATDGSASELLTKMDSNGDGSLNKDELDAGMKSLMPEPASTAEFAAGRSAGGPQGPGGPGGPGGAGGPPPPQATSSSDSAHATDSTDPLDTNQDGVVSAEEKAAGELKDVLKALVKAVDANGDGSIGSSELDTFKSTLDSVLKSAAASSGSSTSDASGGSGGSGGSGAASSSQASGLDLRTLAARVLQQYAQAANDVSGVGATLSVAA